MKRETISDPIFLPTDLKKFCSVVYTTLGMPEADAQLLADSLVQADLWGHQSHGVMRTFWYGARIQTGATKAISKPVISLDNGAVAVVDGNHGVGQVIAHSAMRQAIRRAKQHGIGAVAVRNSGHFGTAMYFTKLAAIDDCVGFLSTNASPAMAPWGGRTKRIGNNPWSIAAPAGKYPPMILDIANTAVARGKLYLARQRGESIPKGWAIDTNGRPTIDPIAGIAGNILPMAGHKGYAIATMMDVLSGVLSGSQFGSSVVGPYMAEGTSGVGHLALALDIGSFRPVKEFNDDMEKLIDSIKNSPRAPGTDEIYYPGELEALAERRNRHQGIQIPNNTVAELDKASSALGIEPLSSLAFKAGNI